MGFRCAFHGLGRCGPGVLKGGCFHGATGYKMAGVTAMVEGLYHMGNICLVYV